MSMRTTRAGALAAALVLHLAGGLTPALVLCVHHDGVVSIERAEPTAVRCDDIDAPCVPAALGRGQGHCHDAAIAQPGIGQRVAAATADLLALAADRSAPPAPDRATVTTLQRLAASAALRSRRTVVLRV